ncbi:MAG: hypothetical protein AB1480_06350 [Nitrospirota bacterium]
MGKESALDIGQDDHKNLKRLFCPHGQITQHWLQNPSGNRQALFSYFKKKEPADFANPNIDEIAAQGGR